MADRASHDRPASPPARVPAKLDALDRALAAHAGAAAHFAAFPPSARTGILQWIDAARRAETRERRVAETARLAARNERANSYRKRGA